MARQCTEILFDTSSFKIPFLLPTLDAKCQGGVPAGGGLVEVAGGPGSGKTCLMLQLCASYFVAQRHLYVFSDTAEGQALERAARRSERETQIDGGLSCGALFSRFKASKKPSSCQVDGVVVYIDCDGGFTASRFLEIAEGVLRETRSNSLSGAGTFTYPARQENVGSPLEMLSRIAVLRIFSAKELFNVIYSLMAFFAPTALADEGSRFNINARNLTDMIAEAPTTKQELLTSAVSAFFASVSALERPQLGLLVVDSLGALFHPTFFPSPFEAQRALLKAGGALLRLTSTSGAAGVVAIKTTPGRPDVRGVNDRRGDLDYAWLGRAWKHFPCLRLRLSPLTESEVGHPVCHAVPNFCTASSDGHPRCGGSLRVVQVVQNLDSDHPPPDLVVNIGTYGIREEL